MEICTLSAVLGLLDPCVRRCNMIAFGKVLERAACRNLACCESTIVTMNSLVRFVPASAWSSPRFVSHIFPATSPLEMLSTRLPHESAYTSYGVSAQPDVELSGSDTGSGVGRVLRSAPPALPGILGQLRSPHPNLPLSQTRHIVACLSAPCRAGSYANSRCIRGMIIWLIR